MLSKVESRGKKEHQTLMINIAEQRARIDQVEGKIDRVSDSIIRSEESSNCKIDSIATKADTIESSITSLRSIGEQAMAILAKFPSEMRNLLRKITETNVQTYNLLLELQQSAPPSPTMLLESNIIFEDALGRVTKLPYEYFRHWEVCIPQLPSISVSQS